MTDFSDFEAYMIDEFRFSKRTVENTLKALKYIENHSKSLDRSDLQEFIRQEWGKSNRLANDYIKIINRWLKYKHEKPLKYFKQYKSFTIKIVTDEEKEKLLETAKSMGRREHAMMLLLFDTGIRLNEAVNLKYQDIGHETLTVKGKGEKIRQVYLPGEAADALNSYLKIRKKPNSPEDYDFIFTTELGRKMSYDYFRKILFEIGRAAGIPFHAHMARHTYATQLLKAGMDVVYVARLLGHEKLDTTQIYLHPSQEDAILQAKKIFGSDSTGFVRHAPNGI